MAAQLPNLFVRKFDASVKGGLAETLLSCLLQDCGYRALPLGVEHSLRELKELQVGDPVAYAGVPMSLRKLPDFFVLDAPNATGWFIEVKFRRNWQMFRDDALNEALLPQVNTWERIKLVAFLGEAFRVNGQLHLPDAPTNWCRVFELRIHMDEVRILSANGGDLIRMRDFHWMHGQTLQEAFPRLQGAAENQTIMRAARIMRDAYQILEAG